MCKIVVTNSPAEIVEPGGGGGASALAKASRDGVKASLPSERVWPCPDSVSSSPGAAANGALDEGGVTPSSSVAISEKVGRSSA